MYNREFEGQVLEFAASGWVYEDTFILADFQTLSMWYPFRGQDVLSGVAGIFAGEELKIYPAQIIIWSEWIARHPNSKFLK